MSYRQIIYHIVFSTKHRIYSIPENCADKLYRFIWSILKNNNCVLYQIGGMPDHIHILCDLHPNIALADLIRNIKGVSSHWLNKQEDFPDFGGWGESYAALTCSYAQKDILINYIKCQKEHHQKENFDIELNRLLMENGITSKT
jgi:putative transposase